MVQKEHMGTYQQWLVVADLFPMLNPYYDALIVRKFVTQTGGLV